MFQNILYLLSSPAGSSPQAVDMLPLLPVQTE